jgi:putative MFS transporter
MTSPAPQAYDDAPLRAFHLRAAVASFGGSFSDGFGLGIIGLALALATPELALTPVWLGLLGGAALAGLFLGALFTGPLADRIGRRPVFAWNMGILGLLSAAQFLVDSASVLLLLRLGIGFLLGTDYVVGKTLLTEFTPRAERGRLLSSLAVAWAAGYASAYATGYALSDSGADAWRWMLLASALPCLLVMPLRATLPESPMWLARQGRHREAAAVVLKHFGPHVLPPPASSLPPRSGGHWAELFAPAMRRRTLVACGFFTCLVIPYFALGTFVARVLDALQVQGGAMGGLVYNIALLAGSVLGLMLIDRLPRRTLLMGSFAITSCAMLALSLSGNASAFTVIALFALFACVLSAASNMSFVYVPELFPTELRASGTGVAIAASRIGSAISTFLLPVVMASWGAPVALGACCAVLALGGILCWRWAPETRRVALGG